MLWRKDNNLYHEILRFQPRDSRSTSIKNNFLSRNYRIAGNEQFACKKFKNAIVLYNKSLCFAENDSEELAIAFANRSACYFELKNYENCLVDIRLAKEGKFPAKLLPKLQKRQEDCELFISQRTEHVENNFEELLLSFPPHESIPYMAECLRIEKDEGQGAMVITTCDLEIGQNVMIEPFMDSETSEESLYFLCDNCCKFATKSNLIPCRVCTDIMFCYNECRDSAQNVHYYLDCGTNYGHNFICRTVAYALNAFSGVDELKKTVEKLISNKMDLDDILRLHEPEKIKYLLFFCRGKRFFGKSLKAEATDFTSDIFSMFIVSPRYESMFKEEENRRFLMHLMATHYLILHLPKNIISQRKYILDKNLPLSEAMNSENVFVYTVGYFPVGNFLPHSCVPNVHTISIENKLLFKVLRPIKRGEKLFMSNL